MRPKPSFGRWLATSFRSWSRNTFSRESLLSSFYTFLWVVPLSVMIWFYAEREELVKLPSKEFNIEARPEPTRVITFAGQGEQYKIRADLMGPHGKLEAVEQRLDSASNPLQIAFGAGLEPGPHRVSIRSLMTDSLFRSNGVSVTKLMPEELTINVDPIVSRDQVEVRVRPEVAARLETISFDRKVKVTAPQSYFAQNPNFAVYADFQNLEKGGTATETVSLVPSVPAPHVTIEPSTVVATFAVKEVTPTVIGSMPVYVTLSPGYRYSVVEITPPSIPNVNVIGSKEAIDKLATFKPYAWFDILMTDVGKEGIDPASQPDRTYNVTSLHFNLPEGVRVTNPDVDYHITFKLKARPAD